MRLRVPSHFLQAYSTPERVSQVGYYGTRVFVADTRRKPRIRGVPVRGNAGSPSLLDL